MGRPVGESFGSEHKQELRKRLRRLEGQVRGVSRMLDEGRSCQEIVQQLAAIRAAAHQASVLVVRAYAAECLARPQPSEATMDSLIQVLSRAIR